MALKRCNLCSVAMYTIIQKLHEMLQMPLICYFGRLTENKSSCTARQLNGRKHTNISCRMLLVRVLPI